MEPHPTSDALFAFNVASCNSRQSLLFSLAHVCASAHDL